MKKRATLKHIAESLNLSVSTVSRILNGQGEFSVETKDSVLKVAEILNYRANSLAVSLRKKKSNNLIGVILPEVQHYFFSSILNGIVETSHKRGFMVMIGESLHNSEKESDLINNFSDYFVSGIILSPSRAKESITNISKLEQEGMPHVIIDRIYNSSSGSFVNHDDYMGAFNAVEHLINQGNKNIALIKGESQCNISSLRAKGYFDALEKNGLKVNPNYIRSSLLANKEDGYQLFHEICQDGIPDAVFTITDLLASGVYDYAQENKIKIPEELAVIGYSNSEIAEILHPKLTSVEQNGYAMGNVAFEFLMDQLEHSGQIRRQTFDSKLIIRQSSQKATNVQVPL
jgi:LacI family transcriptional regulator